MQNIRTDLAMEAHELLKKENEEKIDGIDAVTEDRDGLTVTRVHIYNANGEKALNKAQGTYVTIETPQIRYSVDEYNKAVDVICEELGKMTEKKDNILTLVAGLGNREITPDALGCEVVSGLLVTNHMKEYMDKSFSEKLGAVCAIAPGVLGTTGIETVEIIKGIVNTVNPDVVIAVDALAAADIRRVCTTIQIADTGIQPGAGVGNNRKGLNYDTLGVKVIAVGVPTVIDAAAISDAQIPEELSPLMITTKDIDLVIEKMAKTVANGINKALQPNLSLKEIEGYIG